MYCFMRHIPFFQPTHPFMWLSVSFLLFVHLNLSAQTTGEVRAQRCDTTAVWTVEDCMRYAVVHSHGLRQRELQLDNSKAWHLQAIGALLPSISASASGQWNFGRAIDPETNTYTNVSTLGSGFGLSTNVPLFDGLYRLYALRAARADVLLQKNALQSERDQVALATYQACVEVVYAQETVHLAEEKLRESRSLLRQTQVMEEEGLKSPADVAQVQAQAAADELTLTRQQAQQETAMLKLKEVMGLDSEGPSLSLSLTPNPSPNGEGRIYPQEQNTNGGQEAKVSTPLSIRRGDGGEAGTFWGEAAFAFGASASLLQSFYAVESARHNLRATRAAFFPTVSLSAGINSSYYRNLDAPSSTSFQRQLKNNLGEYIAMNLSIPLFNRLASVTSLRRARNNLRIAQEQYAAKQTELDVLRQQAHLDVETNIKEIAQSITKTAADSLAYELVRQQFTQGLASPIEVQTAATSLLQSRATLLQARLLRGVKLLQERYYSGVTILPSPVP